jgi:hypothetical protein
VRSFYIPGPKPAGLPMYFLLKGEQTFVPRRQLLIGTKLDGAYPKGKKEDGAPPTMSSKLLLLVPLSLTFMLKAVCVTEAQTINAASCNSSDVQAALEQVSGSTTTVNIPAGKCSWGSQVSFNVPSGNTNLTIVAAGNQSTTGGGDATIIVDNYGSNNALFSIVTSGSSSLFRLAGITFQGGSGSIKYNGIVSIGGNSQNVRVDHSHFNDMTYNPAEYSSMIQFIGCTAGVVDHSIFDGTPNSVSNAVRAYNSGTCYGDSLGVGDQSWAHSTSFGSSNFLFMENNVFNNGASDDCTAGGRFVSRFNTFNATNPAPTVQTHPTGGGGRFRGCRALEVYQNHFNAVSGNYVNAAIWISSGTGVVWGNTIPSSSAGGATGYKNFVQLLSMRQSNSTYGQTAPPQGWGYCGSAFNGNYSNWDQNTNSSTGYHCLDQPGMGKGDLLVGGFTSDGSGSNNVTNSSTGCGSGSSCAWPREAQEPIYEWMNNFSPVPSNPSTLIANNGSNAFFVNQDYYGWCNASSLSGCTNFTGSSTVGATSTGGVGSGPLSSRPSSCTPSVGYWATDQGNWNHSGSGGQGELFVCTAPNTWTLYYTPYTYPHPLVSNSQAQPPAPVPAAPVSLKAVAR